MKILYNQGSLSEDEAYIPDYGLKNCYFKKITKGLPAKKPHHHNHYEIHMLSNGEQNYEIDGNVCTLCENEYILIPPKIKHRLSYTTGNLLKYSITFSASNHLEVPISTGKIPKNIIDDIKFIETEYEQTKISSIRLIENRIYEICVLLFRTSGYKENVIEKNQSPVNYQSAMAKKFILDNIESGLSISTVADYCHISPRHLSRLFTDSFELTPTAYIRKVKMEEISKYLINSNLSLKEISEKFSYTDEHYFNSSFKKYFGISPLAYRKMHRSDL